MSKELWLHNDTGADVSIADLGVKVPANKTINVYKYNPYLTEEQVKRSMEDGSLSKRLNNVLSVVNKYVAPEPHGLNHIKASKKPVEVIKTKSAIYVNTKEEDVLEDEDFGDFADYGLGELGHKNTTHKQTDDGSVVVVQKKDDEKSEIPAPLLDYQKAGDKKVDGHSVVAVGENTDVVKSGENILISPPVPEDVKEPTQKKSTKLKVRKTDNSVVIEDEFDTNVATNDSKGKAIVMKLKEVGGDLETEPEEVKSE